MLNEKDDTTATEFKEQVDACFQIGVNYWQDFHRTPNGKELIARLPTKRHRNRAYRLFQFGFTARMLLVPEFDDSAFGRLFKQIYCRKLWLDYLRDSHGEIVLSGECFPLTPKTVLDMAEEFFREGFIAADCECVCNVVENER